VSRQLILDQRHTLTCPAADGAVETRGRKSREAIYRQLAEGVAELRTRLGGLSTPDEAEDIWGDIWYQEANDSTAIEGNTLVLREIEILLSEGRAVGDKQLAEYMEVRGYADAAQWVYQQGPAPGVWTTGDLITMTEVRHVHTLAMTKVWGVAPHRDAGPEESPGSFRRHNIQPFPAGMRRPDWPDVPSMMSAGCVVQGAFGTTQARFPKHWPRSTQRSSASIRFSTAMDASGVSSPTCCSSGWATRRRSSGRANRAGTSRIFVPLAALATSEASALRAAAERGRLRGQQDAQGQWRSTRKWVDDYLASRYRRQSL
jgi:hypothetical protein